MKEFKGFAPPESNYSKLPHTFIELLPEITSLGELKCVLYILRHTWGFSEIEKPKGITVDEFCNGRKRRDGTRLDSGTGMTANSVRAGLKSAEERGLLLVEINDRDKARIKKSYALRMQDLSPEVQLLHPYDEELPTGLPKLEARSEKETSKETKEKEKSTTTNEINYGLLVSEMEKFTIVNAATAYFLDDLLEDWEEHTSELPPQATDKSIDKYEAVLEAIKEGTLSAKGGSPNNKYIQTILYRWINEGFKTKRNSNQGSKEESNQSVLEAMV